MKVQFNFIQLIIILFIFKLTIVVNETHGAKIIALLFFTSKSIKNTIDPILNELANRGHDVTVVSPIHSTKDIKNLRNIIGPDINKDFKNIPNSYINKIQGNFINPFKLVPFFNTVCRNIYNMKEIQEIQNEKFDLVIVSALMNECAYGLMHHFNTISMAVSPLASPIWFSPIFGAPTPPSFVPLHFLELTDRMNFYERIQNIIGYIWVEFTRRYYHVPAMEDLYRDYFPHAPSISEIEKNFSLVLMNSHPILNYPRPLMPDMIEVGGIHCHSAKPLPKELEDFASGSGPAGFILFSMGSILRADQMPEDYVRDIILTFGKLKQRVIWKWEGEQIKDLPPNIKLSPWLPQQDLLGHPNIRIFITHGGLLSTQEAVFHGVPLIGIPMILDQIWNVRQAEHSGYALTLQFPEITEKTLTDRINRILNEPRFHERVKLLSAVFRDQPIKPLDRGIYWTEYILRHKGAIHLRSPSRNLNTFQYHSLDVIFILTIPILLCLYISFKFIRFIITMCKSNDGSTTRGTIKKKKQ